MKTKLLLLSCFILLSLTGNTQMIGETANSVPHTPEITKLSGGAISDNVNTFDGTFSTSVDLGTVNTLSGLSFSLNLNYSPIVTSGGTPNITSGIPYGEGWNINIPSISVSNDAYTATLACSNPSENTRVDESKEGDMIWFDPMINIPGVVSGRAVFKYYDKNAAVFVLHKFEQYVEVHFDGANWKVILADGTEYYFDTTVISNVNAPTNNRIGGYESLENGIYTSNSITETYIHGKENASSLLPKKYMLKWNCSKISHPNYPRQIIQFEYKTYGEFNHFKEWKDQTNAIGYSFDSFFGEETSSSDQNQGADFTVYTDVFPTKITSTSVNSVLETIELNYETFMQALNNPDFLDYTQDDVERKDDLYSFKTVYNKGIDTDFNNWARFKHVKKDLGFSFGSNSNPYLFSYAGQSQYRFDILESEDELSFNHGFLESPRFQSNEVKYYPGDRYEIKTKVVSDEKFKTLDINLISGSINGDLSGSIIESLPFDNQRKKTLFSTFSNAIKWGGSGLIETSNTFVMPLLTTLEANNVRLQIGPGNSDTDYTTSPNPTAFNNIEFNDNTETKACAYNAYWHKKNENAAGYTELFLDGIVNPSQHPKSRVSQNFGIGLPWAQTLYLYMSQAAIYDGSHTISFQNSENQYNTEYFKFWWNDNPGSDVAPYDNVPTLFGGTINYLDEVEIIRHAKNPLMLSSVKKYVYNTNSIDELDEDGIIQREKVLINHLQIDHDYISERIVEKVDIINNTFDEFAPHSTYDMMDEQGEIIPDVRVKIYEKENLEMQLTTTPFDVHHFLIKSIKEIPTNSTSNNPPVLTDAEYEALPAINFEYTRLNKYLLQNAENPVQNMHVIRLVDELDNIIVNPFGASENNGTFDGQIYPGEEGPYIMKSSIRSLQSLKVGSNGTVLSKITNKLGGVTEVAYNDSLSKNHC